MNVQVPIMLSRAESLFYETLRRKIGDRGKIGLRHLAEEAGIAWHTARKCMRSLAAKGVIEYLDDYPNPEKGGKHYPRTIIVKQDLKDYKIDARGKLPLGMKNAKKLEEQEGEEESNSEDSSSIKMPRELGPNNPAPKKLEGRDHDQNLREKGPNMHSRDQISQATRELFSNNGDHKKGPSKCVFGGESKLDNEESKLREISDKEASIIVLIIEYLNRLLNNNLLPEVEGGSNEMEMETSISREFLRGTVSSSNEESTPESQTKKGHSGLKSYQKKIEGGKWEKINGRDILELFKDEYFRKYRLFYSVPASQIPKTVSVLNNSIMKYGAKEAVEIVKKVIKYYEDAGLSVKGYPRPTIFSLTQDWLINKILDTEKEKAREEAWKKQHEETNRICDRRFGPYEPISLMEVPPHLRINLIPEWAEKVHKSISTFVTRGYISREVFELLLERDYEKAREFIAKEVIPTWNEIYKDIPERHLTADMLLVSKF